MTEHSEFFKRFYWSGMDATFHGITWYGDKGSKANYQENVNNAFKTAPYLEDYVSSVGGTKVVLAHSLGNMVVSSAIEDHGMNVDKYLMLDAAVATEAYDATTFNATTNNNPMLPEDWDEYEPQTWSVNFHELYSAPDKRSELTWQGRFENVVSNAYNFYSSEDEVFEIHPSVSFLSGFDLNLTVSRYVWQKQEVFKGCDSWFPGSFGSTKWWGWGFYRAGFLNLIHYPPLSANALSDPELRREPVFRHTAPAEFYVHADNLNDEAVNEMLAMGLPAMSPSAGETSPSVFEEDGLGDTDISTLKNGWPRTTGTFSGRWLHNDCRMMAYLYTYRLFEELTAEVEE